MSSAEFHRLESPTSILTYIQCPRKYYYRYVRRLEQKQSIHLVVGNVVHSTIAAFHNVDISAACAERLFETLHSNIFRDFRSNWDERAKELRSLGLDLKGEKAFYEDTRLMIENFFHHHTNRVVAYQYRHNVSAGEAFNQLRPRTETKVISRKHGLMGVIDAIYNIDGRIAIIDYKTSRKAEMNEEHLTQLALYAVLYRECFGRVPDMVGIHFLRRGEMTIRVTPELFALGEDVCRRIQALISGDDVTIYPQRITGLCKFRTGQCDYYETCEPWNSVEFG